MCGGMAGSIGSERDDRRARHLIFPFVGDLIGISLTAGVFCSLRGVLLDLMAASSVSMLANALRLRPHKARSPT